MSLKHSLWDHISTQYSTLFAGFVGSVVSLRFMHLQSLWERISVVLCGTAMAQYCSPLVIEYAQLQALSNTVSFLTGLLGMSLCSVIFEGIRETSLWAWIDKLSGRQ